MSQSLGQIVRAIANDLPDVTASSEPGAPGARPAVATLTLLRGRAAFAVLGSSGIEIRLDPAIAAAASRTPDTAPSPRGREWVRFNPRDLDAHAIDRLRAWLDFAARHAAD